MIIDELIAILGYDVRGEGELARFNRGIDNAERGARRAASAISTMSVAVGTFVGVMAAEAVTRLGHALGSLPGDILRTGAEFENLEIQLTSLEGSAEKAQAALDWIAEFAKETPLSLQETAKSYADLRNFGIDPTNGSLQALVDTMAMSGKGADHLGGLVLALGQAWTKGKLQGEEALQLIERGVPVWDLLSKATGKSSAELIKMATAGKLGRDMIEILIDQMGNRAVGASEAMSKSWDGLTGRLGDTWQQFTKKVSDAGFFDWAKRQVKSFADLLERMDKDGTLTALAENISRSFTNAGESFKALFSSVTPGTISGLVNSTLRFAVAIASLMKNLTTAAGAVGRFIAEIFGFKSAWGGLLLALGTIGAIVAPVWTAFFGLILIIDDFITYLEGGESLIGAAIDGIKAKFNEWAPSVKALWEDTLAVLSQTPQGEFLSSFIERLQAADIGGIFKSIGESASNLWEGIKNLGKGFSDVGQAIARLMAGSGDGKKSQIAMMAASLGDLAGATLLAGLRTLEQVLNSIANGFRTLGDVLSKLAQGDLAGAFDALVEGIERQKQIIYDAIQGIIEAFVPNFDLSEAWGGVVTFFEDMANRISGIADRIVATANRIREALGMNASPLADINDRRNADAAGRSIGGMLDPNGGRNAANSNMPYSLPGDPEPKAYTGFDPNKLQQMLENFKGNSDIAAPDQSLKAVNQNLEDNRQDNRNQSVTVEVGGVTVQGAQNAGPAVGAAVGNAVGNAAAGAARPARVEGSPQF